MPEIVYRISPASFSLILGSRRILKTDPDVFLKTTILPTGQYLSRYYADAECTVLLHEVKSGIR
jgi:hypothetical protein